ncbi:MAG: hypothetical protein R2875_13755 [Desulfobacterales bacterium]
MENIGRSRRFDRWQANLIQEGQETIRAMGTFSDIENNRIDKRYEKAALTLPRKKTASDSAYGELYGL